MWNTVEHYFQAQKFRDSSRAQKIRNTASPWEAKDLAKRWARYKRQDWEFLRVPIMYDAVRAKFAQHKPLASLLLQTGDRELVELAADDDFWGRDETGGGLNMLGSLLMRVRAELRYSDLVDETLRLIGSHDLHTKLGKFVLYGFQNGKPKEEIVVLKRNGRKTSVPWLLRVQYGCLTGTAFHSVDCDCGGQLDYSLREIGKKGPGLLIYFPAREASGAGLSAKIRAAANGKQDKLAVHEIENARKEKDLSIVRKILSKLKVTASFQLLTNNPVKVSSLVKAGVPIASVLPISVNAANLSPVGRKEIRDKKRRFDQASQGTVSSTSYETRRALSGRAR